MLQKSIDIIVGGEFSQAEITKKLCDMLASSDVNVFSDFDDTLTFPSSILYYKSKIAAFFGFKLHSGEGKISQKWMDWCQTYHAKRVCIVSRGSHTYLRQFFEERSGFLEKHGILIVGFIGVTAAWRPTVEDKLRLIPTGKYYLCDVFEKKWLKKYPNIQSIVINDGGAWKRLSIIVIKCFLLLLFLIKIPQYRASEKE